MPFLREIQLRRDKVADFGVDPFSIPAVRTLETLAFSPGLTCLAGENGSGKSTLIEAIAILAGFNPEGGTKNFSHAYDRTESNLAEFLRPVRNARRKKSGFFLRAESMFNLFSEANKLGVQRYGWEDPHRMSHGESFLYLVRERFKSNSLFVLDEPEAALSPQRQLALLKLIHERIGQGCQFIVATHSPILLGYPGTLIHWLDGDGIRQIDFRETKHYQVTKRFLDDPEDMLRRLLAEEKRSVAAAYSMRAERLTLRISATILFSVSVGSGPGRTIRALVRATSVSSTGTPWPPM